MNDFELLMGEWVGFLDREERREGGGGEGREEERIGEKRRGFLLSVCMYVCRCREGFFGRVGFFER